MSKENIYNNFFNEEEWKNVLEDNKTLLDDYLMELKQNKKSDGTIKQYKNDLRIAFLFVYKKLGNRNILELSKRDFRGYSLYLTGECGLSSARHNRLLSALRSFLTYCEGDDEIDYDNNVARKVKGLTKEAVREIFFLSNEQIIKLKDELIKRKEFQKACLLMLAYDSAGRKNELAGVKKFSFYDDTKSNTNKVIGKRRKVFSLVYFSGTKECASLWLKQRGEDNIENMWVVGCGDNKREADGENIYEWFMHIRKLLADLEGGEIDFNPHSIRHSCLQNLSDGSHYICKELGMEGGFPVEKLKLIANHENIDTTQHYLKDTSIDELAEMFFIKITNN
jgi:integrase/recombinase XerD